MNQAGQVYRSQTYMKLGGWNEGENYGIHMNLLLAART